MKKHLLASLAVALLANTIVCADYLVSELVPGPFQHPDKMHDTWRVLAVFDNPEDTIFAVWTDADIGPIDFFTFRVGALYNQAIPGIPNDFPSSIDGGEPWDSYITIGDTEGSAPLEFSPGFGSGGRPGLIVSGCSWGEEGDGMWFYVPPLPTVVELDSIPGGPLYEVVIAQFTIDAGTEFVFSGNIAWAPASPAVGFLTSPFYVGPVPPPCLSDIDGNDTVGASDLLILLVSWGTGGCGPADVNRDGEVGAGDLLQLLVDWGPCF